MHNIVNFLLKKNSQNTPYTMGEMWDVYCEFKPDINVSLVIKVLYVILLDILCYKRIQNIYATAKGEENHVFSLNFASAETSGEILLAVLISSDLWTHS